MEVSIEKGFIDKLKSQYWAILSISVKFYTELISENRFSLWINPENVTQKKAAHTGESGQVC